MKDTDVRQGTLALMVLKTLDVLGPLHGYGIARRIEQISGDLLTVNQGTLYPVLLKLERKGLSPPNGERPTTTKHASTSSLARGASNCRPKPADGNRPRRSSNDFSPQGAGPEMKALRRFFLRLISWTTSARDEKSCGPKSKITLPGKQPTAFGPA